MRYHSLSVVRNWGLSVNDCPSHFPVRQGKSIFSEKFPKDRFILIAESRFARNAEARPASRSPERERRFLFRARQLCRVASARKSGMFFLFLSTCEKSRMNHPLFRDPPNCVNCVPFSTGNDPRCRIIVRCAFISTWNQISGEKCLTSLSLSLSLCLFLSNVTNQRD